MKLTRRAAWIAGSVTTLSAAILALLLLTACTTTPDGSPPPTVNVTLSLVEEDKGWVQVSVEGVSSIGYRLLWGDTAESYGITEVLPGQTLYEHFYQAVEGETSGEQIPTTYVIQLVDGGSRVVASVNVLVVTSNCHLELVSLEGRTVTVKFWGRFGIEYSLSWGDRFADHVHVDMTTATGEATHTYSSPGTYSLGMEEIWAPSQIFFQITVP